ncbi:hypothetical protein FGM00_16530 [Aggregatimonas sangjinii]|uniref:Uncharacterized protein n=1 Tax=Aggregatimonas sangjinii TaxID=2583587 RepID=A0A5B7SX76_9FLAO|nr:hypothetical protein [Aggregatimonas sangjinii]QCX01638.1 hypothetical protein FGM00_16530 [Aggregatimonas sangjinii]
MKTLKIIGCCLLVAFYSCDKNDDSETTDEFDGSIRSVENFFTPELVKALTDLGFELNEGNTPPNLEGTYLISPLQLNATTVETDQIGSIFSDYTATITNQNNEKLTIDFNGEGGGQIDNGFGSFISGTENKFSIYLKLTIQIGNEPAESAYALSGTITDDGISEAQMAILMLDDKGDVEEVYIENNTGRLFTDGDGFSPKNPSTTSKHLITADIAPSGSGSSHW